MAVEQYPLSRLSTPRTIRGVSSPKSVRSEGEGRVENLSAKARPLAYFPAPTTALSSRCQPRTAQSKHLPGPLQRVLNCSGPVRRERETSYLSGTAVGRCAPGYAAVMPSPGSNHVTQHPPEDNAVELFTAFFEKNHSSAISFVRCRMDGDSESLVADAFLVAWQHFQTTGELNRGWFYGVLRNKIGDHYRSARRREDLTPDPEFAQTGIDPGDRTPTRLDVLKVLRSLPAMYSEPLILAYWCDMSGSEAALALGVREGTFRVRLHRAHRAFAEALGLPPVAVASVVTEVEPWTA